MFWTASLPPLVCDVIYGRSPSLSFPAAKDSWNCHKGNKALLRDFVKYCILNHELRNDTHDKLKYNFSKMLEVLMAGVVMEEAPRTGDVGGVMGLEHTA